jgi:hypothetical protein
MRCRLSWIEIDVNREVYEGEGSFAYSLKVKETLCLQVGSSDWWQIRIYPSSCLGGTFMDIKCPPNTLGNSFECFTHEGMFVLQGPYWWPCNKT